MSITAVSSMAASVPDSQLRDECLALFDQADPGAVLKQGAYKTILSGTVCNTPCVVKRYAAGGLLRNLKAAFGFSRAAREFRSAAAVSRRGIPTAAPLLLAERRRGILCEGLVALPFLSGARELREVFFQKAGLSARERAGIAFDFGRLTARIFRCGIYQGDYSLNNFMVRREGAAYRIYFIDFERVVLKKKLAAAEKIELLAKLNRVGREVCRTDRLRFLAGYLEESPEAAPGVRQLAGAVGEMTIRVLKRDVRRGRLTSLYTHGAYNRIALHGYSGLCRRGYDPAEVAARVRGIGPETPAAAVSLHCGEREQALRAVQFEGRRASHAWAALSTLIIAGLAAGLPPVLIEDGRRGFIIMDPAGPRQSALPGLSARIRKTFADEIATVEELLRV